MSEKVLPGSPQTKQKREMSADFLRSVAQKWCTKVGSIWSVPLAYEYASKNFILLPGILAVLSPTYILYERTAQHDRADAMTACHAACQMPDMSRRTLLLQEWRRLYYIMGEKQNGNPYTVVTAVTVNEWKYPSVTPCGSDRHPHARPEHERARGRWPSAQHAHQRGARSNLGGRPPAPRAGLPKRSRAEGADRPALSANF